MTWEIFREINRSLFAWPNKVTGASFYKLAAALVSTAGLIGVYLKAPDRAAHWLIQNLVTFPALKSSDALNSWDTGSHAVLRVVSTLALLSAMYAISFALVAQERLDYRNQQARALGIKFLKVQRSHDILNLAGDCRTVSAEDFEVYGIHLSHIDRHIRLTTGDKWPNDPKITAENLPPGSAMTARWSDDGPHRTYILNFTGALHETAKPVRLRTIDEISQGLLDVRAGHSGSPGARRKSRGDFLVCC